MSSTQVVHLCKRCGNADRLHGWTLCPSCLEVEKSEIRERKAEKAAAQRAEALRALGGRPGCKHCETAPRQAGYVVCSSCLDSAMSDASMKVGPQGSTETTARAQREAPDVARRALLDPHYVWPKRTARDVAEGAAGALGVLGYGLLVLLGAAVVAGIIWGIVALNSSFQNDVDQVRCVTVGSDTHCLSPGDDGYHLLGD